MSKRPECVWCWAIASVLSIVVELVSGFNLDPWGMLIVFVINILCIAYLAVML